MNLRNKAVGAAYESGAYVDAEGRKWRKGMDGWFLDNVDGKGGKMLVYHHHMVEKIEKEHPDE